MSQGPSLEAYRLAAVELGWDEYGRAAMELGWEDEYRPPVAVAALVYCGAVTATNRTWQLQGGADGPASYLDIAFETLASDPLARAAADELGSLECLRVEMWMLNGDSWERITARAEELTPPVLTVTERCYRRAAIEHVAEHYSCAGSDFSRTALLSAVETYAASRVRWNDSGLELTACHDGDIGAASRAVLRDLTDADPIALAAEWTLTRCGHREAARIVDQEWPLIRARADTLLTLSAIADLSAAL
ncbi:hypothetical protein [Mycobacteroides abscessus]|uniref:hypothetical protein n=1 Tax=Mycobacteroides abscessus TaxID=36809 RepID=UPI0009265E91|nr:hypothetical protein [Mycobacteroides abscessus]SII49811.1 Uncharacterised protein [Mycobacteroides abscessus subsp. abscessus]SLI88140.1 Uncharacterised protein [Mycobacteroides abscessus subsp. abscessus]